MGDKKAKDQLHEGQNLSGFGAGNRKPGDKKRGAGLTAQDSGGQQRSGKNTQGTGL
jgi:hypothetical protein